jgi:hypothetical protein
VRGGFAEGGEDEEVGEGAELVEMESGRGDEG